MLTLHAWSRPLHLGHRGQLRPDNVPGRLGLRQVAHLGCVGSHVRKPPRHLVPLIFPHLGLDVRHDPLALPLTRIPRRLVVHGIASPTRQLTTWCRCRPTSFIESYFSANPACVIAVLSSSLIPISAARDAG